MGHLASFFYARVFSFFLKNSKAIFFLRSFIQRLFALAGTTGTLNLYHGPNEPSNFGTNWPNKINHPSYHDAKPGQKKTARSQFKRTNWNERNWSCTLPCNFDVRAYLFGWCSFGFSVNFFLTCWIRKSIDFFILVTQLLLAGNARWLHPLGLKIEWCHYKFYSIVCGVTVRELSVQIRSRVLIFNQARLLTLSILKRALSNCKTDGKQRSRSIVEPPPTAVRWCSTPLQLELG